MKQKIAFYTSARSDYGPMRPLIKAASQLFNVDVLVTGNHHSNASGLTRLEIEKDAKHWPIRMIPIEFMVDGQSSQAQLKSLSLAQSSMAQWLATQTYDGVMVLGDRWELFGMSLACLLYGIPLGHISGGEVTEGVIDDSIRHAHTKLSHVHFVANDIYAQNVSGMGEEDWRIVISGECGLDSIHHQDLATEKEIKLHFGIDLSKPSILVTYHPSTLDFKISPKEQIGALLTALCECSDYQIILTHPGAEQGSRVIQDEITAFAQDRPHVRIVSHFGSRNYLTVLKKVSLVLGNSSSGLVEAPSFGVPTVNIGNRQKERLYGASVLHSSYDSKDIANCIKKALTPEFQSIAKKATNPYDPYRDGKNTERILRGWQKALEMPKEKLLVKKFDQNIQKTQWNVLLK